MDNEFSKTKRVEAIAKRYTKDGIFKPEIVQYGDQILYEVEQDLSAMKWAIKHLQRYIEYINEKGNPLQAFGDMTCKNALDVLVNRVSQYSCPNNMKSGKECPMGDACTYPECRS